LSWPIGRAARPRERRVLGRIARPPERHVRARDRRWTYPLRDDVAHRPTLLVAAASSAAPLTSVHGPPERPVAPCDVCVLGTARSKGHSVYQTQPTLAEPASAFPPRVLTGDRPTGQLHLGHLFGTLENRVRLQNDGVDMFVLVADYQTITDRDSPASLPADVEELVADYLAVGIDPARTTIFAHSLVPELNQLMLPFLSLVTLPELLRNPTVKDEAATAGMTALNGLMLTYPVHQAADILFCRATLVPVGADQLPHVEQTREIARRFNRRYAPDRPVFPEPEAILGNAPTLLGTDGRKMSKSRNNAITLAATADETARLLRGAKTDSGRRITYDPNARPEVSNLLLMTALCEQGDPRVIAAEIADRGASELKRRTIDAVNQALAPVRRRRAELIADRSHLSAVLRAGSEIAREVAQRTLAEVAAAMHTTY
jgi:tryptophanyl-tRNA synthetase